jgi:hypothetical protein
VIFSRIFYFLRITLQFIINSIVSMETFFVVCASVTGGQILNGFEMITAAMTITDWNGTATSKVGMSYILWLDEYKYVYCICIDA